MGDVITKRCTDCGFEKPFWDFHRQAAGRGGRAATCKECSNARTRAVYYRLRAQRDQADCSTYKACSKCGAEKPISAFHKRTDSKDGRQSQCADCARARVNTYYRTPKEQARKKAYNAANKDKHARQAKEYRRKLFRDAMEAYGGVRCACCGETEWHFLSIDHINNDGAEHRRSVGRNLHLWLKQSNYPPGFQVLCHNCNIGKRRNGGVCPHK